MKRQYTRRFLSFKIIEPFYTKIEDIEYITINSLSEQMHSLLWETIAFFKYTIVLQKRYLRILQIYLYFHLCIKLSIWNKKLIDLINYYYSTSLKTNVSPRIIIIYIISQV